MRSSPAQPGERTDELACRRARKSGSSERGKVVVKADGLEHAPAASGSGLTAIVANRGDEQLHRLQLRQVACNQGECACAESAYGGYGAGRFIGLGSTSAVSCSQRMLQRIGRQRTPDST